MKNKGLFKIYFTKKKYFVLGKSACSMERMFTLQQCRLGWYTSLNTLIIHLLFVDVIIDHWKLKSRQIAKEYVKAVE